MSIVSSLSKSSSFDSFDEILVLIKLIKAETDVYLRIHKPIQTVKSWNNSVKSEKKKIDERYRYKEVTYVCPHSVKRKSRSHKGMRLDQNVMFCNCPVQIHFRFNINKEKFEIMKMELEHKNHPISKLHVQTYARKKNMAPEALEFVTDTLTAGAQPTIVRKLLQDKFGTNLISKDLINIKQTLTGKSHDEWADTVDFLQELQENPNNVIKVLQSSEKEVAAIFVQLELQRKLYLKYGTVIQLDGTYKTTKAGFALYHLLIHDNNGDGQPVAFFFIKEETTEAISECLQIFTENNDVSLTEVTITDKDCAEISALSKFFPKASGILCQFHVLKAVDTHLQNKFKTSLEKKKEIRQWFRSAVYAASEAEFSEAKSQLQALGQEIAAYFDGNWFNIPEKWSYLGRRQLSTFGNNTTNRLERYHHTLKEVLQKNRRLPEVIRRLVNLVRLRLSDRQLKQSIREVRFNTKEKHPVLKAFSNTASPYACKLLEEEMKIVKWKAYDFVLNEVSKLPYCIASRHTNYSLKRDLTACTCRFFMDFGLPCRHIISCHIKNNTEIPAGSFLDHWRNECLENDAVVPACVSSAIGTHYSKQLTRKPMTDKDQFNVATTFFRKVADTLSQLAQSDFEEKMQLFDNIHVLIKEGKPVHLIQSVAPTEIVPPSSPVEHLTDPVSSADEVTSKSTTENKVLHPSLNFLHLPSAPQKRGRPRNNKGYFTSYHKHAKKAKDEGEFLPPLDEEEMFLREEAEHLKVGLSDMPESDHEVAMDDSFSQTSPDLVVIPVEESHATVRVPMRDPYMLKFLDKVGPVNKNNWLGTGIVNLSMKILKLQHPEIGGLYCSTLGGSLEYPGATGQKWLQIVHDGENHWLLVAKGFALPEHVLVYDSSPGVNVRQHVLSCMASLLQTPKLAMTYVVRGCQKQGNSFDCGVFAIAFATSLANGQDPSEILYDPVKLRDHLRTCIDNEVLSPFPSTYCRPRNRGEKIQSIDVFCYCRRTDYASDCNPASLQMVACDKRGSNCVVWVHKMCDETYPFATTDLEWYCKNCVPR